MLLFLLSKDFCSSSFMVICKFSKSSVITNLSIEFYLHYDSQNSMTFTGLSICILDTGDPFGLNCCAVLSKDNITFVKLSLSIKSLISQQTTHATFCSGRADPIEWRLLSQEWQVSLGLFPKKLQGKPVLAQILLNGTKQLHEISSQFFWQQIFDPSAWDMIFGGFFFSLLLWSQN